eukprot:scaffold183406_cov28-Prasinocladus_malaysianus.AAC.1
MEGACGWKERFIVVITRITRTSSRMTTYRTIPRHTGATDGTGTTSANINEKPVLVPVVRPAACGSAYG